MSIFDRFLGRNRDNGADRTEPPMVAQAEEPSGTYQPEGWLTELTWGNQSRVKTLPRVTPEIAQRHATVFACCNIIAGDLAKVPLRVMQKDKAGRAVRVDNHALDYLLNVESGYGIPAHVPRFMMVYGFALRGTGFAYAPRDGSGHPLMIEGIVPTKVSILRDGRARFYDIEDGAGVQRRVSARSMVHLRYMAEDGWTGRSPIQVAAESIGLALAGQEAAAKSASGTQTRGYIKLEDNFDDEEAKKRSIARIQNSIRNPEIQGIPVLGAADEIKSLDLSAADQELLASRKFDREQIAALYRMPPSKLQMLEYGVKANGQQQAIDYRTDCLLHWGNMVEDFLELGLLTRGERLRGLFLQHDYDALMQATTKERIEAITKAVGGPIVTVQEGREMFDMGDVPEGQELYPPSNMTREEGPQKKEGEE